MSTEQPLAKISTQELRAEIKRREEDERLVRIAAHTEHEQLICMSVEVLLQLAPSHDRTSCTDANYANYHGRCLRCALIYAREHCDFPYWLRLNLEEFER